jgi:hypothetical protein
MDVERNLLVCVDGRQALQPTRAVTLEVEMDYYIMDRYNPNYPPSTICRIVRDGTIHGLRPGELIVGPFSSYILPRVIKELQEWITTTSATANDSCGFHVHIDARDLTGYEIRRVINLYRILESGFYRLVSPGRETNDYCRIIPQEVWKCLPQLNSASTLPSIRTELLRMIYDPSGIYKDLNVPAGPTARRVLYPEMLSQNRGHRGNNGALGCRYWGLNIHSWYYRGTLEFRMHEGTVDPEEIYGWTRWCMWFVEMASRLTDQEIEGIRTIGDYISLRASRPSGWIQLPKDVIYYYRKGQSRRNDYYIKGV